MGPLEDGDRLPMIFPDFEENNGQSVSLQNGPSFVSKSRMRIAEIMGEIKGLCKRAGNDAQNGAFLAEIRVSNVASPDDDISPHDFPRSSGNFRASHGSLKWPPFVS